MGRPKGSKNLNGAKSDYKPEYASMLLSYFNHFGENEGDVGIPTLTKFAKSIGTYTEACCRWVDQEPEFEKAFVEAMHIQETILQDKGLTRVFDPNFAKFLLQATHGYREKDEKKNVEITAGNGSLNIVISRKEDKKK